MNCENCASPSATGWRGLSRRPSVVTELVKMNLPEMDGHTKFKCPTCRAEFWIDLKNPAKLPTVDDQQPRFSFA